MIKKATSSNMLYSLLQQSWKWIFVCNLTLLFSIIVDLEIFSGMVFISKGLLNNTLKRYIRLLFIVCAVRVEVEGIENLDLENQMIILANHRSHFDAMAMFNEFPVQGVWLGKKELLFLPIIGWKLAAFGCIFIDRGNHSRAMKSMHKAALKIKEGQTVYIFPEGTRSRKPGMISLKKGAFHLALESGVSIIPVYISGSDAVLAPDSCRLNSGTIKIRVGKPISPCGYNTERINDLMMEYRNSMIQLGATFEI